MAHFLVIRSRGAGWIVDQPLDGQLGWPEHAAFMGRLVEAGSVLLGGPVETTDAVLLLVRAADARAAARLFDDDPWTPDLLPVDTVWPWQLRIGADRL